MGRMRMLYAVLMVGTLAGAACSSGTPTAPSPAASQSVGSVAADGSVGASPASFDAQAFQTQAGTPGGALASGLLTTSSTNLNVYAILNSHNGQYTGTVQFKGWVSFKLVNGMWNVSNPTFKTLADGSNSATASGDITWKGTPSTLTFTWIDVPGAKAGQAWWEVRSKATKALLYGSGLTWPTDTGANVDLPNVIVAMPH